MNIPCVECWTPPATAATGNIPFRMMGPAAPQCTRFHRFGRKRAQTCPDIPSINQTLSRGGRSNTPRGAPNFGKQPFCYLFATHFATDCRCKIFLLVPCLTDESWAVTAVGCRPHHSKGGTSILLPPGKKTHLRGPKRVGLKLGGPRLWDPTDPVAGGLAVLAKNRAGSGYFLRSVSVHCGNMAWRAGLRGRTNLNHVVWVCRVFVCQWTPACAGRRTGVLTHTRAPCARILAWLLSVNWLKRQHVELSNCPTVGASTCLRACVLACFLACCVHCTVAFREGSISCQAET
jgi:hypothetical protein